jgi:hypothetical protein
MKSLLLAVALVLVLPSWASADTPGKDWMTAQQVTEKLRSLGYTEIRELEADDGHWEADVVKDGRTFEVHVDPHSGALTKNEPKH